MTSSAALRTKIETSAKTLGFAQCSVLSGTELEERIRLCAADLLKRFCEGEKFPESAEKLKSFASKIRLDDDAILAGLARAFDRPAFKTHFQHESNLPKFREAIGETIKALKLGILPSGEKIPDVSQLTDATKQQLVEQPVQSLAELRAAFESLIRKGKIRQCSCGQPECPVFMFDDEACQLMDRLRGGLLRQVQNMHPSFSPAFYRFDF